jgi:hypothetical protein
LFLFALPLDFFHLPYNVDSLETNASPVTLGIENEVVSV